MNTNIDLRDDKFLLPEDSPNYGSNAIISGLKQKGINTIQELIDYVDSDFNGKKVQNAYYYKGLVQILKYKYFGEELVNDVIFEKEYSDYGDFSNDLHILGMCACEKNLFEHLPLPITMENYFKILRDGSYCYVLDNGLGFKKPVHTSYIGDADLISFYLEYIEEKKEKDSQKPIVVTKENLENAKSQLQYYMRMRDSLDLQIQEAQDKITGLEENIQTHGRK